MNKMNALVVGAISFVAVFCTARLVFTQGTGAPAPRASNQVVVIDITKVFAEHKRFKQSMDVLKKDAKSFEDFIRGEQQRLAKLAETRKNHQVGSPEYKRIDEQLASESADIQAKAALRKKEFLQREAKLYFNIYNEVVGVIANWCDARGISIVLRFNSDPINPEDRGSVLKGVNDPIVFQRNLDITRIIINLVNQG